MRAASERGIIFVVAAAQFVNILEFVIVMPLGPDYAGALGTQMSDLSYVAAAYTAAAAAAGLAGALFLDRFDRRRALLVTLAGLVLATASVGLVRNFAGLVGARAVAGLFGGPATSVAMSIVADAVPESRRGRAFSIVLLASSLATVFGVPLGLELGRRLGWRAPFFSIACLGLVAVLGATRLPTLDRQVTEASAERAWATLRRLLSTPIVRRSYLMTFCLQMSGFLLIPNLSPFLQHNLGFPRASLGWLYFVGGAVSLISTRLSGRFVDRYGSLPVAILALVCLSFVTVGGFIRPLPLSWVWLFFAAFMFGLALRNVAYNTLASKVPAPAERARFQSLQSTVGHAAISCAGAIGGQLLSTGADGALIGMNRVAWLALVMSVGVPLFMWTVERSVRQRVRAEQI